MENRRKLGFFMILFHSFFLRRKNYWKFINIINNLFPNKHPSIHPRLLWIISSNSNNPLQSQSWLISIVDDTVIPTSNPIHHFSFLPVTPGNKIPAGKSSRIFNRFSCNKLPSAVLPNLPHLPIPSISFHDQNTSN